MSMSALSVPLALFNLLLFLLLGVACLPAETSWLPLGLEGISLPESSKTFMIRNAAVQMVWFFFVAHIPAHISKKMFFVDIACTYPGRYCMCSLVSSSLHNFQLMYSFACVSRAGWSCAHVYTRFSADAPGKRARTRGRPRSCWHFRTPRGAHVSWGL